MYEMKHSLFFLLPIFLVWRLFGDFFFYVIWGKNKKYKNEILLVRFLFSFSLHDLVRPLINLSYTSRYIFHGLGVIIRR